MIDPLFFALPDGHQLPPTKEVLNRASLGIRGYSEGSRSRRPQTDMEDVVIKVIRPQDMPLQVACGNFDLAITGQDWLTDHRCRFPTSPVRELLSLGYGQVSIVAVVSKELDAEDLEGFRNLMNKGRFGWIRVASEYINIADMYAREQHLGRYRIIPTWGASEAFLPEDADLLIENTQTGTTLAKNNLKVIDRLFCSSAVLIGNDGACQDSIKREKIEYIVGRLRGALPSEDH